MLNKFNAWRRRRSESVGPSKSLIISNQRRGTADTADFDADEPLLVLSAAFNEAWANDHSNTNTATPIPSYQQQPYRTGLDTPTYQAPERAGLDEFFHRAEPTHTPSSSYSAPEPSSYSSSDSYSSGSSDSGSSSGSTD